MANNANDARSRTNTGKPADVGANGSTATTTTGDTKPAKATTGVAWDATARRITVTVPGHQALVYDAPAPDSPVGWHAIGIGLINMIRDSYAGCKTDAERHATAAAKIDRLRAGMVEGVSLDVWDCSTAVMEVFSKTDRSGVIKYLQTGNNLAAMMTDDRVSAIVNRIRADRLRNVAEDVKKAAVAGLDALK